MRFFRMLLRLLRELVRAQVVALPMCNSGGLVSMSGKIVKFRGPVVCALRHKSYSFNP